MSFRASHVRGRLTLGVIVVSLVLAGPLPAAGPPGSPQGKSITFSAVNERGTNANQLLPRHDGLKQLEEDLTKSLRPFSPGSLDGMPAPVAPARIAIPTKRGQELLERRRNWMLLDPDKLVNNPTAEDIMGVPTFGSDGKLKEKRTPLEEFLFPNTGQKDSDDEKKRGNRDRREAEEKDDWADNENLPAAVRESQREFHEKLRDKAPDSINFATAPSRGSLADVFGVISEPAKESDPMQKIRKEEWGTLWGKSVVSAPEGLKPLYDSTRSPVMPVPVTTVVDTPVLRPEASAPALTSLPAWQGGLADSLKSFNPSPGLDVVAPLRKSEPVKLMPAPSFSAPRRAF